MPHIVKLDVHHDASNHRVALTLGSEEAGSHTLIVTPEQAREIAHSISTSANLAEGFIGFVGSAYATN
jgi:hypothetical protein